MLGYVKISGLFDDIWWVKDNKIRLHYGFDLHPITAWLKEHECIIDKSEHNLIIFPSDEIKTFFILRWS